MADAIRDALGKESKTTPGRKGELTVWVDGVKIADKADGWPPEDVIVERVSAALA